MVVMVMAALMALSPTLSRLSWRLPALIVESQHVPRTHETTSDVPRASHEAITRHVVDLTPTSRADRQAGDARPDASYRRHAAWHDANESSWSCTELTPC